MYSKSKAKARKNKEIDFQNKANELRLKAERNLPDKRILLKRIICIKFMSRRIIAI